MSDVADDIRINHAGIAAGKGREAEHGMDH
jgi:hypothetical protein